jgi:hypothetical protein
MRSSQYEEAINMGFGVLSLFCVVFQIVVMYVFVTNPDVPQGLKVAGTLIIPLVCTACGIRIQMWLKLEMLEDNKKKRSRHEKT